LISGLSPEIKKILSDLCALSEPRSRAVEKQPDLEINTGIAKYQAVNCKNMAVSIHFGQQWGWILS